MSDYIINDTKVETDEQLHYIANPKRAGKKAHARYELYKEATTLEEYFAIIDENEIKRAVAKADLRYDLSKGYLKIDRLDETEDE